jgi:hypothetical protein
MGKQIGKITVDRNETALQDNLHRYRRKALELGATNAGIVAVEDIPVDDLVETARKYPERPLLVTFSGDKRFEEDCKDLVGPLGTPSFPEIEQPFEVLSRLARCAGAMNRPH